MSQELDILNKKMFNQGMISLAMMVLAFVFCVATIITLKSAIQFFAFIIFTLFVSLAFVFLFLSYQKRKTMLGPFKTALEEERQSASFFKSENRNLYGINETLAEEKYALEITNEKLSAEIKTLQRKNRALLSKPNNKNGKKH